jgi:glycerophosphoryl diester phosphodiesterase
MTEAPENTLPAFDTALAYPIDGIELDVQRTSDGVPVIFHDPTLHKINGSRQGISSHTYQALVDEDWGGWFGKAFRGERLATLEGILQRYSKRTRLLIEIKSSQHDRRSGQTQKLTMQVLDLLDRMVPRDHMAKIFILSFDRDALELAYDQAPQWKYVLNLSTPSVDDHRDTNHLTARCGPIAKLSPAFVEGVQQRGQLVMTWSCNTSRQVDKALDLGVNVIMTDRPGWVFEYLGEQYR